MPEPEGMGSVPVIPAGTEIQLGPDPSIYGEGFGVAQDDPAPGGEATAESAQEEPAATSSEPSVSDADGAVPEPAAESTEQAAESSRRQKWEEQNAEWIEQIRTEERSKAEAAQKDADEARQQAAEAQSRETARQERLQELAQTWGNSAQYSQQLERAIAREDWTAIDQVAEKFGISNPSIDDARALLVQLDEQTTRNGEMHDFWRTVFMGNTGVAWKAMYAKEGVDTTILEAGDIGKSLEHIYEAGGKAKLAEVQGEIDALKAENRALKARAGSLTPSPESGGNGATSGGWNWTRYQHAVANGEADGWSSEKRDQIVRECMETTAA